VTTLASVLGGLFLQPALVVAAAAALTACLRSRTAAARHAVWTGAVLASQSLPLLSGAIPRLRIPLFQGAGPSPSRDSRLAPNTSATGGNGPPLAATGGPPASGALDGTWLDRAAAGDRLVDAMVACWIVGALLLGARRIGAEIRVLRIRRRARPVSNPRIERLFADAVASSGLRRTIGLGLTDATGSPAVAGVLRPMVLLPAAAESWADADLLAVLVHELGHVSRRDPLLNFLADLAATIYWCNPAVHLAVRRMRAESETACDDRVLQAGAEPERYAELLLRVACAARSGAGLPGAAIAMARPHQLESRLLAVLDPLASRHPLPPWMRAALAGLGVLLALPAAALDLRAAPPAAAQAMPPEPDRQADSLAGPASERLPFPTGGGGYRVSPAVTQALVGPDSTLTRQLVAALAHQPSDEADLVRERAAWALGQARDGRLVEPLLEALDGPDWRVQAYAAWALATARDPRAVGRLVPLVGHPVWRLRAMAAYALRASGDPRAEAAMNTALGDPAWQVRVEAVEYFAALGGRTLFARLSPRLADRHVAVRHAAERALTLR
jgi:beta-lactamase regulating signal transducer with metallopeptidase domain